MEATAQPNPPDSAQRGFFESLMDTRFDSLITPKLIRFLYVVSMIVLAIGAIVWIIAGFSRSAGTGVLFLILAPLVALIYLIVVRLYLELIVVAFKIRDATEETASNTRPRTP
jgi:cytochrome b subunit of formate dehydrogenase